MATFAIEIVGGLIQQQQVRRLDQQARQRHPRSFAAAERREPTIGCQGGQADFKQRRVEPGRQRPVGLGGVIERVLAAFDAAKAGKAIGDAERLGDGQAVIGQLREHADRTGAPNRSAGGLTFAREQAQQRGLAAAVAADQAGALASYCEC